MKKCRIMQWAVAWLCFILIVGTVSSADTITEDEHMDSTHDLHRTTNDTSNSTEHEGHEEIERYKVASFDFDRVRTPFVISVWIILASLAKLLFHYNNKLSAIFPESCLLIILGIILGLILYYGKVEGYAMDNSVFFFYLLPPVILDAGYFMPNRSFFDNIGTILLYAIVGTLLNCLWIGFSVWGLSKSTGVGWINIELNMLHCLVFSALLSAVDPVAVLAVFEEIHVNEVLHIVVFGESLLNDGVTVVLYHMFEAYAEIGQENIIAVDIILGIVSFALVIVCSTVIGVLFGLLTAFLTRYTDHVRVVEPLIVLVMGYLSYLLAEIFHLSGILACTFCGITMRKYVERNISSKSHTTIKYFLKMLASTCETIIFMLLGISTVVDTHQWNTEFVLLTLVFCLVYRTIGVIILTFFANRLRLIKLSKVDQFVMAYGGLRGAIAFSLVVVLDEKHFPQKNLFITTTVVVVYFTVFIQGTTIKPLVNFLKVKKSVKTKPTMNEQITNRLLDHVAAGIEDITGHHGNHDLRQKYEYIDNKYLKPLLIREKKMRRRGMSFVNVFNKLNEKDANEYIARRGSFVIPRTESGTALPSMGFAQLYSHYNQSGETPSASVGNDLNLLGEHIMDRNGNGANGGNNVKSVPVEDNDARLDLKVLDSAGGRGGRKMRSDSFFHHVIDDALFKPQKRHNIHQRHMLREPSQANLTDQHARARLRKLVSMMKKEQLNQHWNEQNPDDPRPRDDAWGAGSGNESDTMDAKESADVYHRRVGPRKSVSFVQNETGGDGMDNPGFSAEEREDSDESFSGVTFTVGSQEEPIRAVHAEPTAAEATLPWKRNTGREPVSSARSHHVPDDDDVQTGQEHSRGTKADEYSPQLRSSPSKTNAENQRKSTGGTAVQNELPWRQYSHDQRADRDSKSTSSSSSGTSDIVNEVASTLKANKVTMRGDSEKEKKRKNSKAKAKAKKENQYERNYYQLEAVKPAAVEDDESSGEDIILPAITKPLEIVQSLPWRRDSEEAVDDIKEVKEVKEVIKNKMIHLEVPVTPTKEPVLPWRTEEKALSNKEPQEVKLATENFPLRSEEKALRDDPPNDAPKEEVKLSTDNLPWRTNQAISEDDVMMIPASSNDPKPAESEPLKPDSSSLPWRTTSNNEAPITKIPGFTEPEIPPPLKEVASTSSLPWRHSSPEDDAPVPSPSGAAASSGGSKSAAVTGLIEAEHPSSHSFRLSEAESRHSEHVHHMAPMIDPEAEPRETPVNGDLPVADEDAVSVGSAHRVAQWLEDSDGTSTHDPDLPADHEIDEYLSVDLGGDGGDGGEGGAANGDSSGLLNFKLKVIGHPVAPGGKPEGDDNKPPGGDDQNTSTC